MKHYYNISRKCSCTNVRSDGGYDWLKNTKDSSICLYKTSLYKSILLPGSFMMCFVLGREGWMIDGGEIRKRKKKEVMKRG